MPTQALHFNKNNLLRKHTRLGKSKEFNLKGRKTYKLLVKTNLKRKGKKREEAKSRNSKRKG
jgi:hypothetical protein